MLAVDDPGEYMGCALSTLLLVPVTAVDGRFLLLPTVDTILPVTGSFCINVLFTFNVDLFRRGDDFEGGERFEFG